MGVVNAYDAVCSSANACANQCLDITADLVGTEHYGSTTRWDPNTGEYYVVDEFGNLIAHGYVWSAGYVWSGATMATNVWVPQE